MATPVCENKLQPEKQSPTDDSTTSTNTSTVVLTEGRRLKFLRDALGMTIAKCISAGKFSLFAKNHPSLFAANDEAFRGIHEQYTKKLDDMIKTEVETMFDEEGIVKLMNELDRLVASASSDEAWRPTGVPERDVSAHLVPVKLKEKQKLEELLREADADNHRLQTVIRGRRKRLLRMHESIKDDMQQLVEVTPVFC
ncbi:hypothetical protein NP493_587g04021 [Ridgeia piscesae]|uniref:Polyamine-modulated factor 1 n=1 Tax=Ridgeia piscesae TaxID=27915 RepID=A0AAD9NR91_RIDPI|nr:hypothetical protein NP493_587g04021 [Ridgeia piscesae]